MMNRMRASQPSRTKYPLATIAAYGPDNRRATKLVVGVLHRRGQKDANPMRTWSTDVGDARNDPMIAAEVADWLRSQGITSYDLMSMAISLAALASAALLATIVPARHAARIDPIIALRVD